MVEHELDGRAAASPVQQEPMEQNAPDAVEHVRFIGENGFHSSDVGGTHPVPALRANGGGDELLLRLK